MAQRAHELGMHYMRGYITPIIGDLVEIGVDSWHCVQGVDTIIDDEGKKYGRYDALHFV